MTTLSRRGNHSFDGILIVIDSHKTQQDTTKTTRTYTDTQAWAEHIEFNNHDSTFAGSQDES
jgi:hypothetical protein